MPVQSNQVARRQQFFRQFKRVTVEFQAVTKHPLPFVCQSQAAIFADVLPP